MRCDSLFARVQLGPGYQIHCFEPFHSDPTDAATIYAVVRDDGINVVAVRDSQLAENEVRLKAQATEIVQLKALLQATRSGIEELQQEVVTHQQQSQ